MNREDTPILNEIEQEQALLQTMAEKCRFYTMVIGHLLQRLEAVSPESAVMIDQRMQNLALGLALQWGAFKTEAGPTFGFYVESDKDSVSYVRRDETERRKTNGIGIEVVVKVGPRVEKSGLIGLDGRELPATERAATGTGADRATE